MYTFVVIVMTISGCYLGSLWRTKFFGLTEVTEKFFDDAVRDVAEQITFEVQGDLKQSMKEWQQLKKLYDKTAQELAALRSVERKYREQEGWHAAEKGRLQRHIRSLQLEVDQLKGAR